MDNLSTTIAYTTLTCSCAVTLVLPFIWKLPTLGQEWLLLFSVAIVAGLGELCVIKALNLAQAVLVAPVQYTFIIWDFLWYIVFGNLPDLLTLFRASIVAISGLYAPPYEARVPLVAAQ